MEVQRGIQRDWKVEKASLSCFVQYGPEKISCQDKQERGEGIPLSDPSLTMNGFSWHPIE